MTVDGVERVVSEAVVSVVGRGSIKPLCMPNRELGGGSSPTILGPTGGAGVNNVGLLITTWGSVSEVGSGYIYVDDRSVIDRQSGRSGVKVLLAEPGTYQVGSQVAVTGISSLEPDGSALRRLIRTRRASDIALLE
jgi:hypothetical protein